MIRKTVIGGVSVLALTAGGALAQSDSNQTRQQQGRGAETPRSAQASQTACRDLQLLIETESGEVQVDLQRLRDLVEGGSNARRQIVLDEVERMGDLESFAQDETRAEETIAAAEELEVAVDATRDVTATAEVTETVELERRALVEGEIVVGVPQPDVSVTQEAPEIDVTNSAPDVNVRQSRPQVTVRQPQQTITMEMPAPTITIEQPAPEIVIAMPDPSVDVSQTEPQVRQQQAGEPRVELRQSGEPNMTLRQASDDTEGQSPRQDDGQQMASDAQAGGQDDSQQMASGETGGEDDGQQMASGETAQESPEERPDGHEHFASAQVRDLIGKDVIGEIDSVVMVNDKPSAVFGVGGFLGLGERDVAVSLAQLTPEGDDYVLDSLTQGELRDMEAHDPGDSRRLDRAQTLGDV